MNSYVYEDSFFSTSHVFGEKSYLRRKMTDDYSFLIFVTVTKVEFKVFLLSSFVLWIRLCMDTHTVKLSQ